MAAREQWRSGLGFVLAAAGSAVGLGNLWGFAYRASQGGGGAFLLLYVLIVLVVCLPVLVAEMVLGRSTGQSPLLAPVAAAGRRWQPMGWLFVLAACGILAFYAVLMGWTGVTLLQSAFGGLPQDMGAAEEFFAGLSGGRTALLGQLISLLLTALVVAGGVQKGIERLSRWGLPLLFVVLIALAIWASGLEGAASGYRTFCCVGMALSCWIPPPSAMPSPRRSSRLARASAASWPTRPISIAGPTCPARPWRLWAWTPPLACSPAWSLSRW